MEETMRTLLGGWCWLMVPAGFGGCAGMALRTSPEPRLSTAQCFTTVDVLQGEELIVAAEAEVTKLSQHRYQIARDRDGAAADPVLSECQDEHLAAADDLLELTQGLARTVQDAVLASDSPRARLEVAKICIANARLVTLAAGPCRRDRTDVQFSTSATSVLRAALGGFGEPLIGYPPPAIAPYRY
jgi:hypothetical protein